MTKINKVIVFDLDETLGSFNELISLWFSLEQIKEAYKLPIDLSQELFNKILDLYPEFLRYGILTILEFLNYKKMSHQCFKICIYTNNIYSPTIPEYIQNYFHYKLNSSGFFDQLVGAFKINGIVIEPLRTQNEKTHSDLIRCARLPRNTEICFVDNSYYEDMEHKKIYYIQPKRYDHGLAYSQIVDRFIASNAAVMDLTADQLDIFSKIILSNLRMKGGPDKQKTLADTEVDIIVSQKLMYHMKEFFYWTTRKTKTKKNVLSFGRFTRKKSSSNIVDKLK